MVPSHTIPFDKRGPTVTSGLRLGTPSVTTRGMKEEEMVEIADMIVDVLNHRNDQGILARIRDSVRDLCDAFPLYKNDDTQDASWRQPIYSYSN